MKISIVMLAYNHERFIAKALKSVLMQETEYEYELIVGEDCSSDRTREIIKEYEKKFKGKMVPLYRKKNLGMTKNLLDCLRHCKGEYIAMLEGDDCWIDSQKLQKQIVYLKDHPEYIASTHNWNQVDSQGNFLKRGFEESDIQVYTDQSLNMRLPGQTSTLIVRNIMQDVYKKYRNKIIRYSWIPMDTLAPVILLKYGNIVVFPDVMSEYRYYIEENGTNWSSKYELDAKENYLYFFIIAIGIEKFAKEIGFSMDLSEHKLGLFKSSRAVRGWSKRKKWLWIQGVLMLLLEPHRIRFFKLAWKERERNKR